MQDQATGGWLSRIGATNPIFPALTALPVLCFLPFAAAHASEAVHHHTSARHTAEKHNAVKHVAERHSAPHHAIEHKTTDHKVAERRPEHHVAERGTVRHTSMRHVAYIEHTHGFAHGHRHSYTTHAFYRGMSCVPFARADTGIDVAGNAWQWWDHAAGKYARGHVPTRGSVLNFRANGRMRLGHVAVVDRVINAREITVDQANWPGPGSWHNITRDVPVVDISPNNDWTAVRVGLGDGRFGSVYPTYGFIYAMPDHSGTIVASTEPPAPTPVLNRAPRDLRSPAERVAASRASFNEVAEAPAIAAPDNGHDLAVGSSLRLDAPNRSLR